MMETKYQLRRQIDRLAKQLNVAVYARPNAIDMAELRSLRAMIPKLTMAAADAKRKSELDEARVAEAYRQRDQANERIRQISLKAWSVEQAKGDVYEAERILSFMNKTE